MNERVEQFAQELYARTPHAAPKSNSSTAPQMNVAKIREQQALQFQKWNRTLQLLSDHSSDDEKTRKGEAVKKKVKKTETKQHLRRKLEEDDDDGQKPTSSTSPKWGEQARKGVWKIVIKKKQRCLSQKQTKKRNDQSGRPNWSQRNPMRKNKNLKHNDSVI
jgi:hypothetical protein